MTRSNVSEVQKTDWSDNSLKGELNPENNMA